jgi:hypothetical protein
VIDRKRRAQVVYLAGVPRFLFGRAARGLARKAKSVVRPKGHDPARLFSDELAAWDLAGFFYGKHFYRTAPGGVAGKDTH